jgi:hypothetical protein
LVAEREYLELEGGVRSEAGAERREEGEKDRLHGGSKLPYLSGAKRQPPAPAPPLRETPVMTVVLAFSGRTGAEVPPKTVASSASASC